MHYLAVTIPDAAVQRIRAAEPMYVPPLLARYAYVDGDLDENAWGPLAAEWELAGRDVFAIVVGTREHAAAPWKLCVEGALALGLVLARAVPGGYDDVTRLQWGLRNAEQISDVLVRGERGLAAATVQWSMRLTQDFRVVTL